MTSLRETQELFWSAITWPTGVRDFLQQVDEATRDQFHRTFRGSSTMSAEERVDVYAESYYWRLHGVLEEQFPLEAWLLGETRFRNLVTDFVLALPSANPDIRQLGARFPAYVRGHSLASQFAGLADLAAVDWALTEVLDAVDEPALDTQTLQSFPIERWPELRFTAARATRLLQSTWDFTELWRRRARGDAAPSPSELTRHDPKCWCFVWRESLDVYHRICDPGEGPALDAMMRHGTFEEVCDAARDSAGPNDVAAWLTRWIGAGAVVQAALPGAD